MTDTTTTTKPGQMPKISAAVDELTQRHAAERQGLDNRHMNERADLLNRHRDELEAAGVPMGGNATMTGNRR